MGWKSAVGKVVEAVVFEIVKASEERLEARIEKQAIASEKRFTAQLEGFRESNAAQLEGFRESNTAQLEGFRESNTAQHNELHARIDSVKAVAEAAAKAAAAAAEESKAARLQGARLEGILLGKGDSEPQD